MANRLTQDALEALQQANPSVHARLTQDALEALQQANPSVQARLTQLALECLVKIWKTQTISGVASFVSFPIQIITGKASFVTVSTQTITGKANFYAISTKTVTAVAKFYQPTSTKTVTGKANFYATRLRTITGVARFYLITSSKTITGVVNFYLRTTIWMLNGVAGFVHVQLRTLTGKANFVAIRVRAITGKANFVEIRTITGKANFVAVRTRTITGKVNIAAPPAANVLVTQAPIEWIASPPNQVEVTQAVVETIELPTTPQTVLTQEALEWVALPATPQTQLTQLVLEVIELALPLAMNCGASLPPAIVGNPYSGSLVVTGGNLPYSFAVLSGSLPAGLTLNSATGVISGTPTAVVTASFTVEVTDAHGTTSQCTMSIVVGAGGSNIYTLRQSKLTDDDYGQVSPYYMTYFSPTFDQEQQLQLGGGRKLFSYVSAFVEAGQYLPAGSNLLITFYGDIPENQWALSVNRLIPSTGMFDIECEGGSAQAQRIAVKFAAVPAAGTDCAFSLQKVILWIKVDRHLPVRGSA